MFVNLYDGDRSMKSLTKDLASLGNSDAYIKPRAVPKEWPMYTMFPLFPVSRETKFIIAGRS